MTDMTPAGVLVTYKSKKLKDLGINVVWWYNQLEVKQSSPYDNFTFLSYYIWFYFAYYAFLKVS